MSGSGGYVMTVPCMPEERRSSLTDIKLCWQCEKAPVWNLFGTCDDCFNAINSHCQPSLNLYTRKCRFCAKLCPEPKLLGLCSTCYLRPESEITTKACEVEAFHEFAKFIPHNRPCVECLGDSTSSNPYPCAKHAAAAAFQPTPKTEGRKSIKGKRMLPAARKPLPIMPADVVAETLLRREANKLFLLYQQLPRGQRSPMCPICLFAGHDGPCVMPYVNKK